MRLMKNVIAKLLVGALLVSSITVANPNVSLAATKPVISKTAQTILEGKKFNLNVNNKVKGSTYAWKTSNKKVATVNSRGIVTGITKGKATITCVVTTPKTTYELTSKIVIRIPATEIAISNKVKALNVGQTYNLNKTLTPKTSNDLTTLKSSDVTIANPKSNGVFTALKEGTVTITATTLSGAKDTVTIKVVDKDGIVTTQAELDALLGSGVAKITLKTDAEGSFTIAKGDYSNQTLVIDAPKATVKNEGTFKTVTILNVKDGGTSTGGTGGSGGTGGTGNTGNNAAVEGITNGNVTTYTLPTSISSIKSATVSISGASIEINGDILATLQGFLSSETTTVNTWKNTTNTTKTYNGQTVTVTGAPGSLEKNVTISIFNQTYKVTVDDTNSSVTVVVGGKTYVIGHNGNNRLTIENAPASLRFIVNY